ncbi:MAG: hypothetical protein QOJ35_3279 [Solirubrobacteraceae bacterium]|nr:hypothetical protein [Solirubrobacteraceae bacterium]
MTVEALFRLHATDVLAYALRRTDAASAEDVVSEVFLVAGRKLDAIPREQTVLWLYGVARRVLANQRRGERRRVALTGALMLLQRDRVDEPGRGDGVLEALAALRPADREALMLVAWEGLDTSQAAAVLGCSPDAMYVRLHRARSRLQAELTRRRDVPVPVGCPEVSP